jgi:hypothetical protein
MSKNQKDLLKQRLVFPISHEAFRDVEIGALFNLVKSGKITKLAELLHGRRLAELQQLLNTKDPEGRTPLFYACYYNYKNLVLFLLLKGADPSIVDFNQVNLVHVLVDQGNYESLVMLINYIHFDFKGEVDLEMKRIQKEFNMKRSDVSKGVLVSPDAHMELVRTNFSEFMTHITHLYTDYQRRVSQP